LRRQKSPEVDTDIDTDLAQMFAYSTLLTQTSCSAVGRYELQDSRIHVSTRHVNICACFWI